MATTELKRQNVGGEQTFDERKLRELILYVTRKCVKDDPKVGSVKLNKTLYYSDFFSFIRKGKAITGVEYRRDNLGPAPVGIRSAVQRLEVEGALYIYAAPTPAGRKHKQHLPLRDPDLSVFSAEEIAIVDDVIDMLRGMTGPEVSDMSHEHAGWSFAAQGETIPYFTALLPDPDEGIPLTEEEWAWVQKVSQRMTA
jgi:hypothetical protein